MALEKRHAALAAIVLGALLVLAGCSGRGHHGGSAPTPAPSSSTGIFDQSTFDSNATFG